ncbi:MAG: cation diffusion facilitator family transporter, partial [Planctomycetota bacterium]
MTPRSVTWTGLITDGALAAGKIIIGLLFLSQTLLADGLHSASDLITDVAVLAGLRVSERPADITHHYGHRRVSTLVGTFIGMALIGAAAWIAYNAVESLHHRRQEVRGILPLIVAAASVPVKEALFRITRYVGRRSNNVSLLANAWHHRTDAFTSVAATAGLAGVAVGGSDWAFLDPLTAMVLSAFLAV